MDFKVIEILSADEIIVEPEWVYNGLTGKKVVIWGYETPKKGMYGFDFAKQKYNLGAISTFEYNTAKTRVQTAQGNLIQSKYDYVFKLKVLDFYQGKTITF